MSVGNEAKLNTLKPWSHYLPAVWSSRLVLSHMLQALHLHITGSLHRKQDGGTKQTAEARRVLPGGTWGGGHWHPVRRKPQVRRRFCKYHNNSTERPRLRQQTVGDHMNQKQTRYESGSCLGSCLGIGLCFSLYTSLTLKASTVSVTGSTTGMHGRLAGSWL